MTAVRRTYQRERKRREAGVYVRGAKPTCKRGHPLGAGNLKSGRRECLTCSREQGRERERARRRARGVAPRSKAAHCARGHDQRVPGNARPKGKGCAVCHRETQRERYHADPERHRRDATDYAKRNRDAVNARIRRWRVANRERERARTRDRARRRRGVDHGYGRILEGDPCSYCGNTAGEVDHIDAVVCGGGGEWENLTAACRSCNASKHDQPLLAFLLRRTVPRAVGK